MVRQIIRYTFEKSISVCVFIREDSARTCRILEAYYSGDVVAGYLKTEKFQIDAENRSEAERLPYAVIKGRK